MKAKFKSIWKNPLLSILSYPITLFVNQVQVLYGPPPVQPLYGNGIRPEPFPTTPVFRILSSATLPVVTITALIIGLIIFLKRKKK